MGNQRVIFPVDDEVNKVLGINGEFFDSDLIPDLSKNLGTIFTVHFAFSNDAVISYTIDGGATFYSFLNGDFVQGESGHMFQITLRTGDTFNIKTSVAGTLRFCRVDLV